MSRRRDGAGGGGGGGSRWRMMAIALQSRDVMVAPAVLMMTIAKTVLMLMSSVTQISIMMVERKHPAMAVKWHVYDCHCC